MTHNPGSADDAMEHNADVLVRVAPVNHGGRQIGGPSNAAETLASRLEDVRKGIAAGTAAISASMADVARPPGWRVGSVEATFGITLASEGTVIVAKASLEASFEVTVTYRREDVGASGNDD